MDSLIDWLLANVPNLVGFVLLAAVMYRQNERLLMAMLDEIQELRERLSAVEAGLGTLSYQAGIDPLSPPHNRNDPKMQ